MAKDESGVMEDTVSKDLLLLATKFRGNVPLPDRFCVANAKVLGQETAEIGESNVRGGHHIIPTDRRGEGRTEPRIQRACVTSDRWPHTHTYIAESTSRALVVCLRRAIHQQRHLSAHRTARALHLAGVVEIFTVRRDEIDHVLYQQGEQTIGLFGKTIMNTPRARKNHCLI